MRAGAGRAQNICFEVLDEVKPVMRKSAAKEQTVFRAKFSAITAKDVKRAMQSLGEPNHNESLSVDARQELDLRLGCAFTRFQTRHFQGKYGDLDSSLISYGPCQTPTLGFCVERHDRIQTFQPEAFWVLDVRVLSSNGRPMTLAWDRVRTFDRQLAEMFLGTIAGHKRARVTAVEHKAKTRGRPVALNTVELMRCASAGLGMCVHHTLPCKHWEPNGPFA